MSGPYKAIMEICIILNPARTTIFFLGSAVLCCIILHCIVLCYIALYFTELNLMLAKLITNKRYAVRINGMSLRDK